MKIILGIFILAAASLFAYDYHHEGNYQQDFSTHHQGHHQGYNHHSSGHYNGCC